MGLRKLLGLRRAKLDSESGQSIPTNGPVAFVGPPGPIVETSIGRHRIFVRSNSPDAIIAKLCLGGEFSEAIERAKPLEYNFIVDAGGFIGTAAIAFAEAFPNAIIVTLEPSSENFAILSRNVARFSNIVPLNVAITQASGSRVLRNRKTGECGYSIVPDPKDCDNPEPLHEVECVSVVDILARFGSSGIDILKLDIEGSEYELLKPRPEWLSRVRILVAEIHDRIVPGCKTAFDKATEDRDTKEMGEKYLSVQRSGGPVV